MLEIQIPKAVRALDLGEYMPEMQGNVLEVWVNPPAEMLKEISDLTQGIFDLVGRALKKKQNWLSKKVNEKSSDGIENRIRELFSELLSQGRQNTCLSASDLKRLADETFGTDPNFWPWLQNKMFTMIREHREGKKKA
jgi:hypothetical protein